MNGFYNVLKSTSMTSSDVVVKLRGILRASTGIRYKVGHLGTLDPGGSGVLPIAVGDAVKLFNYLIDKTKVYRAQFVLGTTTDTLDSYGQITGYGPAITDVDNVRRAAAQLVGIYGQIPPVYSAKSVGGARSYDLARRGEAVALPPRLITVYRMDLIEHSGNRYVFDIECSGGTYVRALCRDMASILGTVGYMSYIIRLRSGDFHLADARTLDEIAADRSCGFVSLADWAAKLPVYAIDETYLRAIQNGQVYPVDDMPRPLYRIDIGAPYAVGCAKEGRLKIICKL